MKNIKLTLGLKIWVYPGRNVHLNIKQCIM